MTFPIRLKTMENQCRPSFADLSVHSQLLMVQSPEMQGAFLYGQLQEGLRHDAVQMCPEHLPTRSLSWLPKMRKRDNERPRNGSSIPIKVNHKRLEQHQLERVQLPELNNLYHILHKIMLPCCNCFFKCCFISLQ